MKKTLTLYMLIIIANSLIAQSMPDQKGMKETLSVKLKGFIQTVTYAGIADAGNYTDQFRLCRARLDIRITGGRYLEGRVQGDLASNRLTDAYIVVKPTQFAQLTLGQFKHPMSRERAQSVPSLFFNDFSYTAQVAPNRELGIRLSGTFLSGFFSYQLAVLNGSADGGYPVSETLDAKDIAGRVVLTPFPNKTGGFSVGIGGSYGLQQEGPAGSVCTPGRTKVFAYDDQTTIEGESLRLSTFITYYGGRITVIGEYINASHHMANYENSVVLINHAGSISLSLVLAGGVRQLSGFVNNNMINLSDGCWGGWELVTRVHGFFADPETFPHFATAESSVSRVITADGGINWYLFDNTCLKLIYSESHFKSGSELGDRLPERLLTLTANLAF
jgi:phosphate-selective porin